jgi:ATP-dependent helicase/DNAse subunit B
MTEQVSVEIGPARSGKTQRLLELYRHAQQAAARAGRIGRCLWIAPTSRAAGLIREKLAACGESAYLSPGVTTFDGLSRAILVDARTHWNPIAATVQRELLRNLVAQATEAGLLRRLSAIASRSGFIDQLVEHIRELKRRGISPEDFGPAAARFSDPGRHGELAWLYAEYQRLLTDHELADFEGRHWIARDYLSADSCPSFRDLKLVVCDGFTDFNPTQHNVLRLLAERADVLRITLPGDSAGDDRADLFAKTEETLAELRRHHPRLGVKRLAPRPSGWPAMDYLSHNLFRNPFRSAKPGPAVGETLSRLEIVAAAGPQDEIVQVARRIKQRLVRREAAPSEIIVVFRSLHEAAPRVQEVFSAYGIPFAMESRARLIQSPLLKALLSLLRLAVDDWPFRRVVAVLTDNMLTAIEGESRRASERLVRELQIARGCDELLDRARHLAEIAAAEAELTDEGQLRALRAKAALPALSLLAGALGQLPATATRLQWLDALRSLGVRLGLLVFAASEDPADDGENDPEPVNAPDTVDRDAWSLLGRSFAALDRLDALLGQPSRTLNRQQVLDSMVDVATHESLPAEHDETGRVRVLSAPSARTVEAAHVYLVGMSELAFPAAEPAGRLYSDAEYRLLQRDAARTGGGGGADRPGMIERSRDEMLLFYEVLTRASNSLTISYPALDERAQSLPPSPYVVEIERLFVGDGENGQVALRRAQPRLSPIPIPPPHDVQEWRVLAVAQGLSGEPGLLAGLIGNQSTRALGAAIDAGVRIVDARAGRDQFSWAEGMANSPAVAAELAKRFGPAHHWSPSRWEGYAACPFKFLLTHVLGLEPLGDLVLQTDPLRRGSLAHQVLAEFHRSASASSAAWETLRRDEGRFAAELTRALAAAVADGPRVGIEGALLELDRRQIENWLSTYPKSFEKYDALCAKMAAPMRPTYFELRFGPARPGGVTLEDPRSRDEAFELDIGGEKIRIIGRIDRIDVGDADGRTLFNLIDYKSGRRPPLDRKSVEAGERLQPALYVMAAQALLFGEGRAVPLWSGYWSFVDGVSSKPESSLVCSSGGRTQSEEWEELQRAVVGRVGQLVRDIRGGVFPVYNRDEQCTSGCEFRTVCRIAQVRSTGKCWPLEMADDAPGERTADD